MADADGRLIPLVEDDQGEGIKDFLEDYRTEVDALMGLSDRLLGGKAGTATETEVKERINAGYQAIIDEINKTRNDK